ncbi:MAG TPA: AAA family ATPase [Thermoplasmata archaeon]|nr:AAA family ATPase [Thermoplasmata archaeon]
MTSTAAGRSQERASIRVRVAPKLITRSLRASSRRSARAPRHTGGSLRTFAPPSPDGRRTTPPARRKVGRKPLRNPGSFALTGTPGTGKSSVAIRLRRLDVIEVADAAVRYGAGRRAGASVLVDVALLRSSIPPLVPGANPRVLVGHLSHFLPVQGIVVLRCHPLELRRRLDRARRGSEAERRENVASEALDVVLVEALGRGRPVWEIDTTRRTPDSVARAVERIVRRPPSSRFGRTSWLVDPRVTDLLLRQGA